MNDVCVRLDSVCKQYIMGEIVLKVLSDVNIEIHRGEFISIMGPSGSGKSTLLYLVGGLDKPSSGEIQLNGKNLSGMKDLEASILRRRDLGFVFQFYNLIQNLNVEENILLPLLLDGKHLKSQMDRLDYILDATGLSNRRKHTPRELSGGQQQRVAIARALIGNPDIILADEPTGNLDSATGKEIMNLLRAINREQGKTILMVTHSEEAAYFGTREIHLKDGRIVK